MCIKDFFNTLLKEVRKNLTFWILIKRPPRWVLKAHHKWKDKLPSQPYDMTKHFVGKNHIYKVRHGTGRQGEAPIIGWYVKKRIK